MAGNVRLRCRRRGRHGPVSCCPAMEKAGYSRGFTAAIVGAASTIGPIIPPSLPFVIYGSIANASIGRLLLAGAIPGILMGIMLMNLCVYHRRRRGLPQRGPGDVAGAWPARRCGPCRPRDARHHPGGIIGGIMTPTEAASAGAAYAFFLGFFVYKETRPPRPREGDPGLRAEHRSHRDHHFRPRAVWMGY